MTERYASVDIGSNSCLLLIVEKTSSTGAHVILDTKLSTRASVDVARQGAIGKDAAESLYAALQNFQEIIKQNNVARVHAVGTQVFRVADNGDNVAEQIRDRFSWELEVIPGEEEARLSYIAATGGLDSISDRRIVADVGGGSTEVVIGEGTNTAFIHSFPVGAVNLTEMFALHQPVSEFQLAGADGYLSALLMGEDPGLPDLADPDNIELVITGGTIATLGGVFHHLEIFDPVRIHGTRLQSDWVEHVVARMMAETLNQRRAQIPFDPERAEIILAGTLLVRWLLNWSTRKSVIVSNRGLRWGVLESRFPEMKGISIKQ